MKYHEVMNTLQIINKEIIDVKLFHILKSNILRDKYVYNFVTIYCYV